MVKNLIIAKWVLTRISKRSSTRGSLTSNLAGPIRFLYPTQCLRYGPHKIYLAIVDPAQ